MHVFSPDSPGGNVLTPYLRAGRRAAANAIRGPQSALTDFLASHNISAHQIHQEHLRRLREAQEQAGQQNNEADEDKENDSAPGDEAPDERKKRKRKEEKALMKIKQSKEFKRRKFEEKSKKRQRASDDDDDSDYDDDLIARKMLYKKSQPLPGQFENCENCEKRFTVTAYSKTGPDGGLLCTKCSKEIGKEDKKQQPKKRGAQKGKRRQTESDRLMGDVKPGTKSLLEICVRKVAANIVDIEEFGDLPQSLLDRLSQVLSQKRALDPRTLELFLQSDSTRIAIYDAAKLETDDFEKIFSFMPELEDVNLRNAGQMKDGVLAYMLEHNPKIIRFQLDAANLITNQGWLQFFQKQGHQLEIFKTSDLDAAMDDGAIESLVHHSPNLQRLKLKKCWQTTEASILSLCQFPNLRHLSLSICSDASADTLKTLVTALGWPLQTLSLESFQNADDTVLDAIHSACRQLTKMRFTNNVLCTDAGFAALFTSWPNPPLSFIDLSDTRDVDNQKPGGPEEAPIGLASAGFKALMSHSGPRLERLNLKACRHISHHALMQVFSDPDTHTYPVLRDIDMSFVAPVDEVVIAGIFKCCPKLEKLAIFGCNQVKGREVSIPGGVAVIGMMDAQESVVIEGGWGGRQVY